MNKYLVLIVTIMLAIAAAYGSALWKGLDSFLFAWVLNLMLMAAVKAATDTIKPGLRSSFYQSKPWERNGRVYKWVGVNLFRKLLVIIGWEKLNKAANPVKKSVSALRHLERTSRESEFGHWVLFFIVSGFAVYVGVAEGLIQSLWLIVLNILLNLYPVLVQRYNRPRILRMIALTQQ